MRKNEAEKAYAERQDKVELLLAELAMRLDGHGTEKIHWGHVGDLGHVIEQLEEINIFLGKEEN